MREKLIEYITWQYKKCHLTEVQSRGWKDFKNGEGIGHSLDELNTVVYPREEKLQKGEITIEEYLNQLNDFELICAFDSQCCQNYR